MVLRKLSDFISPTASNYLVDYLPAPIPFREGGPHLYRHSCSLNASFCVSDLRRSTILGFPHPTLQSPSGLRTSQNPMEVLRSSFHSPLRMMISPFSSGSGPFRIPPGPERASNRDFVHNTHPPVWFSFVLGSSWFHRVVFFGFFFLAL